MGSVGCASLISIMKPLMPNFLDKLRDVWIKSLKSKAEGISVFQLLMGVPSLWEVHHHIGSLDLGFIALGVLGHHPKKHHLGFPHCCPRL
jgi:hypothetical protein